MSYGPDAMRDMLERKLRYDAPRLRARLMASGDLGEFIQLKIEGALATQRTVMAGVRDDDPNGQAMMREFVREELLDLSSFDES